MPFWRRRIVLRRVGRDAPAVRAAMTQRTVCGRA